MARRGAWILAISPVLVVASVLTLGVAIVATSGDGGDVPDGGVSGGAIRGGIAEIPAEFLPLISGAVMREGCPALTESVLAAQLFQESGFNPSARSPVGATGIAQFMPGTWPSWGRDENGNGLASALEPEDAIPAAARFDCAIAKMVTDMGIPGDPAELMLAGYNAGPGAVQAFNGVPPFSETQNYVRAILELARDWAASPSIIGAGGGAPPPRPGVVERTGNRLIDTAVAWAVAQVGSWYQWGGTCTDPFGPDIGRRCDCSSLMQQAYRAAGVPLPRVAADQSRQGIEVPLSAVRPGDLVATVGGDGTRGRPGHIGMYVGGGNVVEAPFTGRQVQFFPLQGYNDIVTIRRIVS